MTPEEKQAIIDKAFDLGFKKHRGMRMYSNDRQDVLIYSTKPCFYFARFEDGYRDSVEINTPEQLETIFDALVPENNRLPFN